jgi:formate/nitrite transporter FocA (FNT family)
VEELKKKNISEDPPLFKKWRSWYILVLANLAGLIILFYLFTKIFE